MNALRLNHELSKSELSLPTTVTKRDGAKVSFDISRIEKAVTSCYNALPEYPPTPVDTVVQAVATSIAHRYGSATPTVEQIQDLVELALLSFGEVDAARRYIAYREEHAKIRAGRNVPAEVREAFDRDAQFHPTPGQRFMYYDKYARFNWDLMRRETWPETVDRSVDHLWWEVENHFGGVVPHDVARVIMPALERVRTFMLNKWSLPSMRMLAMAGKAAQLNSMALYNCSYLPVKDIDSFVEAMLISMAGCGVGFSVERQYVEQFPRVKRQTGEHLGVHVIIDTTEGWGDALRIGLQAWWTGKDIDFDPSGLRKAGSVLKTKGGRASGPEPLMALLKTIRSTVLARQGTFIRTTDAHLMMCATGEAAVQGGVRRTAMISLFDWDDRDMRNIKTGNFNKLLWNANNSAVWPEDISDLDIAQQMLDMARARAGEPGIFSRANALRTKPARRQAADFGTNPCGEILLRPFEFCNLSQAVSAPGDDESMLRDKVEVATIIGTIQSLSTRFPGLREEWKSNCEEERLLGVDLTAQMNSELLRYNTPEGEALRERLEAYAVEVNAAYAEVLGINPSAAVTCNKPAGNSAEFIDGPSGIGRFHSAYMLRRMQVDVYGPLFRVLRDSGVPMEPRYGWTEETAASWVVEFPRRAPEGAPLKRDASAVEQCEFWLLNKRHWTEHNPSCTVTYREDELIDLISWVCAHKEEIGGLTFFPIDDTVHQQLPFEEITEEEYNQRVATFPEIDYALLYAYEHDDMTTAAQELACFAGDGSCEL